MTISGTVFSSFLITLGGLLGGIAWAGYFDRSALGDTAVAAAPAPAEKIVISAAVPTPGVTPAMPTALLFRRERTRFVATTPGSPARAIQDTAAAPAPIPVAYASATRAPVTTAALVQAPTASAAAATASAASSPAATAAPRKPQHKQTKPKADTASGTAKARQRPNPTERPAAAAASATSSPGSWLLALFGVNTNKK